MQKKIAKLAAVKTLTTDTDTNTDIDTTSPDSQRKYSIIYADPPWRYQDKALDAGGAERHYSTMPVRDICALPVANLAADNAILFLWCTWPMYAEGLKVVEAWGFSLKTVAFVWMKTNKRANPDQTSFFPSDNFDDFLGLGRWTRSNSEFCLLATKGRPKRASTNVRQIICAPIGKHSAKPPETRDRIVKLAGNLPRVELFARQATLGWDTWGNEIETDIVLSAQGVK